jgi:hypothetical protein
VKRALEALIIGGAFGCILMMLGHHAIATPVPILFLFPGILTGALVLDSGFNIEGDIHSWGRVSTIISYAVNIAIYGGLAYLFLHVFDRLRRAPR